MAEHPLNRHLFIADNLNLLRALDNTGRLRDIWRWEDA
jgi:hypothetical protein